MDEATLTVTLEDTKQPGARPNRARSQGNKTGGKEPATRFKPDGERKGGQTGRRAQALAQSE